MKNINMHDNIQKIRNLKIYLIFTEQDNIKS